MIKKDKESLIRYLLIVAIVLVAGLAFAVFYDKVFPALGTILRYIGVLLSPFLIAWLLAVITRPLTDVLMGKLRFPPSLAVLLMMLVMFTLLGLLVLLLVSVISNVVGDLSNYIASLDIHIQDISTFISGLLDKIGIDYAQVQEFIAKISDQLGAWASSGIGIVVDFAKATPAAIFIIIVTIIACFYWCRDEFKVKTALAGLIPLRFRKRFSETYENISNVVGQYVRAQLILISISFVICTLGFAILGVEGALPLGVLTALFDIIPVLGPGTLIVPWAAWAFISGDVVLGVGLLVIYLITSVTRYILEPKIVGDRVGLHPLAALAAIFIGMRLFGLVGLILGPIVLAVIVAIFRARRQRTILDPNDKGTQHKPQKKKPPEDNDGSPKIVIK